MPWTNGDAHDAAREAQLDHALTGVIGYHPADHSPVEGPLNVSVGSSSSGIELDVNGGPASIKGERVEVSPSAISLEPGDDENPRKDIVYVDESGGLQSLPGTPGDNTIPDMDGNECSPVGSQAPLPEPASNAHRIAGAILAVVWVPSGAVDSSDLNQADHVHDRRRPAPDTDQGAPRQPSITSDFFDLPAGEWAGWPIDSWNDQTVRLWKYTLYRSDFGMVDTDNFLFYIIDYSQAGVDDQIPLDDDQLDWSDYAVWESDEPRQRSSGSTPLHEIDTGAPTEGYGFIIENISEFDYTADQTQQVAMQITHTTEDTDQI